MPSALVRVNRATHAKLKELARRCGVSMQEVLDDAVERQRRRKFLEDANASYARLLADPAARRDESAERADWDRTDGDTLTGEQPYPRSEPGRRGSAQKLRRRGSPRFSGGRRARTRPR